MIFLSFSRFQFGMPLKLGNGDIFGRKEMVPPVVLIFYLSILVNGP